jgi:hypothetical protein
MTLHDCIALYELAQTRIRFVRPVVTPLGHAVVAAGRAERREGRALTRRDLEEIAQRWNVRTDDLWPLIADDEPAADQDDAAA